MDEGDILMVSLVVSNGASIFMVNWTDLIVLDDNGLDGALFFSGTADHINTALNTGLHVQVGNQNTSLTIVTMDEMGLADTDSVFFNVSD